MKDFEQLFNDAGEYLVIKAAELPIFRQLALASTLIHNITDVTGLTIEQVLGVIYVKYKIVAESERAENERHN